MNEDKMRKDFEAWARRSGRTEAQLHRGSGGDYTILIVHWEWMAWQAATRAAVPAWQPIETAPRHGRELFLLLTPSKFPQVVYSNSWHTCGFSVECKPTHWMPLPAAPEVKP